MKKNDTNDEKSDATPDDPPVIASSSKDNPEMEVIVENLTTSRKSAIYTKEGFIADQTPENEQLEINDENDGQTLELEPESPSSDKSVLVFEAWKQYRQQSINL